VATARAGSDEAIKQVVLSLRFGFRFG